VETHAPEGTIFPWLPACFSTVSNAARPGGPRASTLVKGNPLSRRALRDSSTQYYRNFLKL